MPTYNSIVPYVGNGATTLWNFAFEGGYIDPTHVFVSINGATPTAAVLANAGQVQISPPVSSGTPFRILRITPVDGPLVDYAQGASVSEDNLDRTARQSVLAVAEQKDTYGDLEARSLLVPRGEAPPTVGSLAGMAEGDVLIMGPSGAIIPSGQSGYVAEVADLINQAEGVRDVITALITNYFYFSVYGTRYRYAMKDGAVVAHIAPHIYIDPFNGSDLANGLTVATAIKTSAGLAAHPLLGAVGTMPAPTVVTDLTIGIVGHATSKIRDSFDFYLQRASNGYRQMHRCSFVKVGDLPVHFDGTDIVTAGSFTPHGSIANAYVFSKAHTMDTGASNRFRGWVNGKSLKRVQLEASLAPGKYWYSGDPTAGAAKSISFIDHDSSDPRSSGRVVEFTTRQNAISTRGGLFQGIWGERNGHNDGILASLGGYVLGTSGATGAPCDMVDCLLYEGTKHHAVISPGRFRGVSAVNSMDNEYDPQGGAAYLTFYDGDINGKQGLLQNVHFIADTSLFPGHSVGQTSTWVAPFLAHDTVYEGVDLARLDVIDCSVIGISTPISGGAADVMVVRGLYAPGTTVTTGGCVVLSETGQLEVHRSVLAGGGRWVSADNIKMRSCVVLGNVSGAGGQITTVSRPGSIDIENCMILTSPQQSSALVDLNDAGAFTFRRNVAGPGYILGVASYEPTVAITVNNDYNVVQVHVSSNYYVTYKSTNYEMAGWKALNPTFDPNTVIATMASQFVSGLIPTITNLNIQLLPGSPAALRMTDPLTQAEVEAMQARPNTYATAQAYHLAAPHSDPVLAI